MSRNFSFAQPHAGDAKVGARTVWRETASERRSLDNKNSHAELVSTSGFF